MIILFPVVISVVLVFFGYLALWSSSQGNVSKGISQFGSIMSIILYVTAGLVIIFSLMVKPCPETGMAGKMNLNGVPPFQGQIGHPGFSDMKNMPGTPEKRAIPGNSNEEVK